MDRVSARVATTDDDALGGHPTETKRPRCGAERMTGRKLRGQIRAEGTLDCAPFPSSNHGSRPCRVVADELTRG